MTLRKPSVAVCDDCYADLHPGITVTVRFYAARWPDNGRPVAVIRQRTRSDHDYPDIGHFPVLAAYLSAHRTMINGSAHCAALAVTERDWPGWPDCSQTVQSPCRIPNGLRPGSADGGGRGRVSGGVWVRGAVVRRGGWPAASLMPAVLRA